MTIVSFWNVNMGNSDNVGGRMRRSTFRKWAQWATPDILFVEELSANLLPGRTGVLTAHDGIAVGDTIADIAGMTYVNHVETLQQGDHPASTKNIVALHRTGLAGGGAIRGRALRMLSSPLLDTPRMQAASARAAQQGVRGRMATGLHIQPRMCLKLTGVPAFAGGKFEAIGVHAKSGGGGRGRQAVAWALDYLRNARDAVIGGDFNYDFNAVVYPTNRAGVAPLLHGGALATFTQWATGDGHHPGPGLAALGLPASQAPAFTVLPHGVIDYALYNTQRIVTGVNSVPAPVLGIAAAGSLWRDILRDFDHMPVSFNVI